EDLYRDDGDRMALAQLPDMERQAILYDRGEKRNQIRERNSLKAQLRAARGLPPSFKNKKTAAAATPRRRGKASAASSGEKSSTTPARRLTGVAASLDAIKKKRQSRASKREDDDSDFS